jgi:hypothetical protein
MIYLTSIIVVTSLTWYYSDELKSAGVSILDWIVSNWPKPSGDTGDNSNSSTTPTTTNIQSGSINSRSTSPDIILDDQRSKLTSASLENLNEQAEKSWGERVTSPTSSTSSNETIKASSSNVSLVGGNDNLSWSDKLQNLSSQGGDFLNLVRDNWKDLLNS